MKTIHRRSFLNQAALGFGGALTLAHLPFEQLAKKFAPLVNVPLGFQTYPIRSVLAKDFPGTLKTMADYGYRYVELCSPPGYAQLGFNFLANLKASEIRKIITDAGLVCPSCHYGLAELTTDTLDERIAFAHDLGLKYMVLSTFWLPKTATLDDYLSAADKLNKAAEKIQKAGLQTGFHNHEFEFATLDGQLIYDALMKRFDPRLVKMQFQTEVINLGYKAVTYFEKYPGRFFSSHLSDWTPQKKEVPIGQGVIDWKAFFAAAPAAGVEYYYVEMELDTFKDSASYIRGL